MRTSGRITSAKGYKIFVTLDKGWLEGAFNQKRALAGVFSVIVKTDRTFTALGQTDPGDH